MAPGSPGTPIGRPALVRLFSTILKREDGKHFLVTPVEKVGIRVDDAPFLAVEMLKQDEPRGRLLRFRTNVDDWVDCDAAHRLRFEAAADGGLTPYLHVRADLGPRSPGRSITIWLTWARSEWSMGAPCLGWRPRANSSRWRMRSRRGKPVERTDAEDRSRARRTLVRRSFSTGLARGCSFEVPPGLNDASIIPISGDPGNDRMLQIIAQERPIRPAAVLIPIVDHAEPTVLLTQRAAHLNDHAGQISFPGGKIDATDASPLDAALREAEEEIGLGREFIDPIGYLDLYATGFGFRILPTLARVKPGFKLRINENEVDDAFEVPLAFLMNPANHQLHAKEFRGMERSLLRDAVCRTIYLGRYGWNSARAV